MNLLRITIYEAIGSTKVLAFCGYNPLSSHYDTSTNNFLQPTAVLLYAEKLAKCLNWRLRLKLYTIEGEDSIYISRFCLEMIL